MGYLIITSYLSSIQLYGLFQFPSEFYKEALMRFLYGAFYAYWPFIIVMLIVALLKHLRERVVKLWNQPATIIVSMILTAVIALVGLLIRGHKYLWDSVVIYVVLVPALFAAMWYLAVNNHTFDYNHPFRSKYGFVLVLAMLLYLAVPIYYGDRVFDLTVYPIDQIDIDEKNVPLSVFPRDSSGTRRNQIFYVMHQTDEWEVVIDASNRPARTILIKRDLVQAVSTHFVDAREGNLRDLLTPPGSIEKAAALNAFPMSDTTKSKNIKNIMNKKESEAWLEGTLK
jgi:hypothetical protein